MWLVMMNLVNAFTKNSQVKGSNCDEKIMADHKYTPVLFAAIKSGSYIR
jgi:hypothetical protein